MASRMAEPFKMSVWSRRETLEEARLWLVDFERAVLWLLVLPLAFVARWALASQLPWWLPLLVMLRVPRVQRMTIRRDRPWQIHIATVWGGLPRGEARPFRGDLEPGASGELVVNPGRGELEGRWSFEAAGSREAAKVMAWAVEQSSRLWQVRDPGH